MDRWLALDRWACTLRHIHKLHMDLKPNKQHVSSDTVTESTCVGPSCINGCVGVAAFVYIWVCESVPVLCLFWILNGKYCTHSTPAVQTVIMLSTALLQILTLDGMTTICCPGSSKSFWWSFAPDKTDWTVICMANWSWHPHPHQPAPVVKKTKPQSMFYKAVPFATLQEKMCGLSALPWRPNSTAASRSWRRWRHSPPEQPWSCRLWTPRRRRRRRP